METLLDVPRDSREPRCSNQDLPNAQGDWSSSVVPVFQKLCQERLSGTRRRVGRLSILLRGQQWEIREGKGLNRLWLKLFKTAIFSKRHLNVQYNLGLRALFVPEARLQSKALIYQCKFQEPLTQ